MNTMQDAIAGGIRKKRIQINYVLDKSYQWISIVRCISFRDFVIEEFVVGSVVFYLSLLISFISGLIQTSV